MITTIIISRDRPAQLHLLLESLKINGGNLFDITVLYESSSDYFEEGYKQTQYHFSKKYRRDVSFPIRWKAKKSENINEDLLELLSNPRELVCLFNDQNILFDKVCSYRKIKSLFTHHSLSSLSLRLGNNTVIQNPYEAASFHIDQPKEGDFVLDRFLVWDATKLKSYTNFATPFSTNGHIYYYNLIKNVLERTNVDDFEQFELVVQKSLYNGAFVGKIPPNMACLEYSAVLHNSCNKVSDYKVTRYDNSELGINHRYTDGMRIQYNDFDFKHVSKPYQDFTVYFK
jgi:hypothetical protein